MSGEADIESPEGAKGSEPQAATPPAEAARSLRNVRIGLVLFVAVALAIAYKLGVFHIFAEPARVKAALVELGPWGYVAFIVAYACLQPFGVPGTVFVWAAPLIWPWPVAFGLSMVGTMAASVVGFSFARFIARDWVKGWVPARFHAYDEALAKRGFATVVTLRFIFWMPPMLHIFFGVSRVPFWTHFWGSLVGYIVPLLATAYFGEKLFDYLKDAPPSTWIALGAAFFVTIVTVFVVRRIRSKKS